MPFGLFRKKESETPQERIAVKLPSLSELSIQQAQALLQDIDEAKVKELAIQLTPIVHSTKQSLQTINRLANDMEHEKIKLEGVEQRFKSVAENARKTIVTSLRREASTEYQIPQSANDVKKFKEKFESMMNRFGEVSGSHSKVINAFMKKYANMMREEFESLTKSLNTTRNAISDFEQKRMPVIKCNNILNTASQKISSIKSFESMLDATENDITNFKTELTKMETELDMLKASPEFDNAKVILQKAEDAEKRKEQFHSELTDLFSHISRAFTKYSYGLTRETETRLQTMSEEPWKILDSEDVSPYTSLLTEIRKSIESGKIQLKDSDKILNYLDTILNTMPELQLKASMLQTEIDSLYRIDTSTVKRAIDLEENILLHKEGLERSSQNLEQQRRQKSEKASEVEALLGEAGAILATLTGQNYTLKY